MAAGLIDRVMKMTDVVALIDAANPVPAVRDPYRKRDAVEISNLRHCRVFTGFQQASAALFQRAGHETYRDFPPERSRILHKRTDGMQVFEQHRHHWVKISNQDA